MKKVLLTLAIGIVVVYAVIAVLMIDAGGIFNGNASSGGDVWTVNLVLNSETLGGRASVDGGQTQWTVDEGFDLTTALPEAVSNNRSYIFNGWYVSGTRVTDFAGIKAAKGSTADVMAVAYWEFSEFKDGDIMFGITLDLAGGALSNTNFQNARYGDLNRGFGTPYYIGYSFLGWFYNGEQVETHEDIVPIWTQAMRPNYIIVTARWSDLDMWWEGDEN